MIELNYVAIGVAAVAVFIFAAIYYSVIAPQRAEVSSVAAAGVRPSPVVMAFELVKSAVVALVVAALARLTGTAGAAEAVLLGVALWIAFPVVLLLGSVVHEGVAPKLAAIHAGDWLVKLLVIAVITTVWR